MATPQIICSSSIYPRSELKSRDHQHPPPPFPSSSENTLNLLLPRDDETEDNSEQRTTTEELPMVTLTYYYGPYLVRMLFALLSWQRPPRNETHIQPSVQVAGIIDNGTWGRLCGALQPDYSFVHFSQTNGPPFADPTSARVGGCKFAQLVSQFAHLIVVTFNLSFGTHSSDTGGGGGCSCCCWPHGNDI